MDPDPTCENKLYGPRHSIRLKHFDYASHYAYYVTICVDDRRCLFGSISAGTVLLNDAGLMVAAEWQQLSLRFPFAALDYSVVMPNHFHGIVVIETQAQPETGTSPPVNTVPFGTGPGSLGRIVQAFKSLTTNRYIKGVKELDWRPFVGRLWQRNYWEHVVRDDEDLNRIRDYFQTNPQRWELDRKNPARTGLDEFDIWMDSFTKTKLR